MSPAALPWWGWLLCSAGAWIVFAIAKSFDDEPKGTGCFPAFISIVAGLIGLVTGALSLILFVKWVWNS